VKNDTSLSMETLAEEIRRDSKLVSDRSHNFKKYLSVVVGSELVAWLVYYKKAANTDEAVALGQKLIDVDLLHHVVDEHKFKNEKLFYRFRADEVDYDPKTSLAAANIAKLATRKGVLMRKSFFTWSDKYAILRTDQSKLYVYESDLSATPTNIVDLGKGQIDVTECGECKKGSYCFTLSDKNDILTLCANKSVEQEGWIQALMDAGAKFVEDEAVKTIAAKSLFEFKVVDIDKNEVDLRKYEGKVCMVVNVACF